jgi:porphobilinogen synthase
MESLTAIRRAGADVIITYFAKDAAAWLAAEAARR